MYRTTDLANFALMNFERGLDGLTEEEARIRLAKADGTQMNSISWITGHIAWHWSTLAAYACNRPQPDSIAPFTVGAAEPPLIPPLAEVRLLFTQARDESRWLETADDALLSSGREEYRAMLNNLVPVEIVGTALMRAIFHTWYHIGEVNAIRQIMGHPEITFTGPVNGLVEWHSEHAPVP